MIFFPLRRAPVLSIEANEVDADGGCWVVGVEGVSEESNLAISSITATPEAASLVSFSLSLWASCLLGNPSKMAIRG